MFRKSGIIGFLFLALFLAGGLKATEDNPNEIDSLERNTFREFTLTKEDVEEINRFANEVGIVKYFDPLADGKGCLTQRIKAQGSKSLQWYTDFWKSVDTCLRPLLKMMDCDLSQVIELNLPNVGDPNYQLEWQTQYMGYPPYTEEDIAELKTRLEEIMAIKRNYFFLGSFLAAGRQKGQKENEFKLHLRKCNFKDFINFNIDDHALIRYLPSNLKEESFLWISPSYMKVCSQCKEELDKQLSRCFFNEEVLDTVSEEDRLRSLNKVADTFDTMCFYFRRVSNHVYAIEAEVALQLNGLCFRAKEIEERNQAHGKEKWSEEDQSSYKDLEKEFETLQAGQEEVSQEITILEKIGSFLFELQDFAKKSFVLS